MARTDAQAAYIAKRFSSEKIRDVLVETFDATSVTRQSHFPILFSTSLPMTNRAEPVPSVIPLSA
jgi:hypothetical protein